jgi:hypothetical protein
LPFAVISLICKLVFEKIDENGKEYVKLFLQWDEVKHIMKQVFAALKRETSAVGINLVMMVRSERVGRCIQQNGWHGRFVELNKLGTPKFAQLPPCVVAMFPKCGMNFHLNMTIGQQYPQLLEDMLPNVKSTPRVIAFAKHDKSVSKHKVCPCAGTYGYLHCPVQKNSSNLWIVVRFLPFLLYIPGMTLDEIAMMAAQWITFGRAIRLDKAGDREWYTTELKELCDVLDVSEAVRREASHHEHQRNELKRAI